MCTSSLAAHSSSGGGAGGSAGRDCIAVGSETGVVSLYHHSAATSASTLFKSVMSLTHRSTIARFHPSGQLLAIASNEVYDVSVFHLISNFAPPSIVCDLCVLLMSAAPYNRCPPLRYLSIDH